MRSEVLDEMDDHSLPGQPASAVAEGRPAVFGYVRQADGRPLGDAVLTLIDLDGRQVGSAQSTVEGWYRILAPGGGTFLLLVSAEGHPPAASMVALADRPVERTLTLAGGSSLTGAVRAAGTQRALAGATVMVSDVRGEVVGTLATGDDGRFTFGQLSEGEYTLVITAAGYRPVARGVSVRHGQESRQDVELDGGGRLGGVVRSSLDGRALSEAQVTLVDPAGNVVGVTSTDEDGGYVFTDLPAGEYTVIVSGYLPATAALQVGGGETLKTDLTLRRHSVGVARGGSQ